MIDKHSSLATNIGWVMTDMVGSSGSMFRRIPSRKHTSLVLQRKLTRSTRCRTTPGCPGQHQNCCGIPGFLGYRVSYRLALTIFHISESHGSDVGCVRARRRLSRKSGFGCLCMFVLPHHRHQLLPLGQVSTSRILSGTNLLPPRCPFLPLPYSPKACEAKSSCLG